jgi:hypothetical protein
MDGEERNASLPILGSHEIFPRTDPTGPRNSVVVTEVALRALFTATRPLGAAMNASRKGKGDPTMKKQRKIGGKFGQSGWPGVTGSDVTLCWVLPGPLSGRMGEESERDNGAGEMDKNRKRRR